MWVLRVRGSVFPLFQILSIALSPSSKNKSQTQTKSSMRISPLATILFLFSLAQKIFSKSVHTVSIFSCLKLHDKDLPMTSNLIGKFKGIFQVFFLIDCLLSMFPVFMLCFSLCTLISAQESLHLGCLQISWAFSTIIHVLLYMGLLRHWWRRGSWSWSNQS